METQFFILGHMILYVMCMILFSRLLEDDFDKDDMLLVLPLITLMYFIPLEIIYWVLHWWLV